MTLDPDSEQYSEGTGNSGRVWKQCADKPLGRERVREPAAEQMCTMWDYQAPGQKLRPLF